MSDGNGSGSANVKLAPEDAAIVESIVEKVRILERELGRERERHLVTETAIMDNLARARQTYENLVEALAPKYVKGKWSFRPEACMFVGE